MSRARALSLAAPAKVNLLLRVLGRREDGYHEIETLFQGIDVTDHLEVSLEPGGGPDVTLDVVGPDLGPADQNLAWRAARAALDAAGAAARVRIRLVKRVPAGAGLGGGSSDAAAVLRAVNALLGSPLDAMRLRALGAALGSDVPFFLGPSPLAVGRGRGEALQPLTPLPSAPVVLVLPLVHVATGEAYAALAEGRHASGVAGAAPRAVPGGGAGGTSVAPPASWTAVEAVARNDFEEVIPALHPEVAASLDALRGAGAPLALLSGSGAACFGVFHDDAIAERAAAGLSARLDWPVVVTRTLERWKAVEEVEPPPSG